VQYVVEKMSTCSDAVAKEEVQGNEYFTST
jgi:hypothetical protein